MQQKEKTAVEWLFEQIARRQGSILHTIPFYNENQDLLIQAKEIEEQQLLDFFGEGNDHEPLEVPRWYAEQYYLKKFYGL
jgi:hypothetical protein